MTTALSAKHYAWAKMPKEAMSDHLDRKLITGSGMTIAHIGLPVNMEQRRIFQTIPRNPLAIRFPDFF